LALIWACIWRGALRWAGALFFAAGVAVYVSAPQPIAAFDSDLRAVYVRDGSGWTLAAGGGRSTFARDRLGAMLGIAPAKIERLAAPESCGASGCVWLVGGAHIVLARAPPALVCAPGAIVITAAPPPGDYVERCAPSALIDPADLAERGGGFVYRDVGGVRVERAQPRSVRRAWTPRAASMDQE
jgi:hypothetical protein